METPRARAPETFPKPQAFARSACCFPLPGASGGARIAGLLKQLAAVRHGPFQILCVGKEVLLDLYRVLSSQDPASLPVTASDQEHQKAPGPEQLRHGCIDMSRLATARLCLLRRCPAPVHVGSITC